MIPLTIIKNNANDDIGAIVFTTAISSPWVSLLAGVPQAVPIPSGAAFVRFGYDQGGANVYVSPDAITIPTAGSTENSRAETNPIVRFVGELVQEGITDLNVVSSADTTIHCHFYTR